MRARTFVDTNVLAYLFDDAEPDKQSMARTRLAEEILERELVISTQVLQELYVALTKGRTPIASPEVAAQAIHQAAQYTVVQVDTKLVFQAIDASQQHRLSLWDALIVRAAAEARCDRLLSEDLNAGQHIASVQVINPFAGD